MSVESMMATKQTARSRNVHGMKALNTADRGLIILTVEFTIMIA
jgi:hypothetical protein